MALKFLGSGARGLDCIGRHDDVCERLAVGGKIDGLSCQRDKDADRCQQEKTKRS